ncbi:MAG TPA: hypothetical protein VGZ00_07505 [Candidatus Baltobacteraceae bacterium]|nr:hypothetical protein [Candidatus Baltobacteraceae bacterium]
MGDYYGVKQVEKLGQKLDRRDLPPVPQAGMSFIVIADNGRYRVAGDVTLASEYARFLRSADDGDWREYSVYEIPTKMLEQCPNVGRVPSVLQKPISEDPRGEQGRSL